MKKKFPFKKKKSFGKRYIFSTLILVIGFSGFLYYGKVSSQRIDSSLASDYYPTQYSDRNITENAKISNPNFEKTYKTKKESLLSNVVSSFKRTEISSDPNREESGTWLWTDTLKITPEYRNLIISEAKKNNINSIYISIDTYLDIFVMSEGKEKNEKQEKFDKTLRDFIKEANKNGIVVDAEAGWRNWAEEGNTYKAFAVLDYVKYFNAKYDEKFRGIQYDIEPYLLPDFKEKNKEIMANFIKLSDNLVYSLEDNTDLELSFVIPEFYDGVDGRTERFFYKARYTFAFDHLLKILEKRSGSKIILMSYRNFTDGIDGSISISKDEIERANKYKTKIILAQEFGKIDPPIYTFYNTSRAYYEKHVSDIEKNFSLEKSFGGIAAHYINALIELD